MQYPKRELKLVIIRINSAVRKALRLTKIFRIGYSKFFDEYSGNPDFYIRALPRHHQASRRAQTKDGNVRSPAAASLSDEIRGRKNERFASSSI